MTEYKTTRITKGNRKKKMMLQMKKKDRQNVSAEVKQTSTYVIKN